MSDLRELIVSIDFDGIDLRKLTKMDSAIDEIEDGFKDIGAEVDDATKEINNFSKDGTKSVNKLDDGFEDLKDSVGDTNTEVNKTGDTTKKATKKGKKGIDDMGDAFSKFKGVAVGAITTVVTTIGGLIAASGTMAMEMENSFDRLEARTGATGAELEGLETIATNVFNGAFGESISEVSDNVSVLNSMFSDLSDKELQKVAEGAYTISDLWGPEVKEVSRTVSTLTKTFEGLTEAQAMDLITTGFQKTGDYSEDLLDTFNEYSTVFSNLGYDAEGFTATLIAGAESGAFNMDKLADSAKEGFLLLGEGADDSKDALKLMGLDANQVIDDINSGGDKAQQAFMAVSSAIGTIEDPSKRNQAAIAAFGTPLEDLGPQFQTFFSDVNQDLGDFEGATESAADAAYDNFGTRMTSVFRNVKTEMSEAFQDNGGEELLDAIATKAEELIPLVGDLVQDALNFATAVQDNWPAVRETIIGITVATTSFVGILGALKILSLINTLMIAFRAGTLAATVAQWGLVGAMLANPMTWVVAGIAALIAIGVLLVRNWDKVSAAAGVVWEAIKSAWSSIWDSTQEVWYNIKLAVVEAVNGIIDKINDMINLINKIPGVSVPIVPKVENPDMPASMLEDTTYGHGQRFGKFDGSHATGLARVPFDGYRAELHQDEAILTAKQANAFRSAGILSSRNDKPVVDISGNRGNSGNGGNNYNPVYHINIDGGGDPDEIERKTRKVVREENDRMWRMMNSKQEPETA